MFLSSAQGDQNPLSWLQLCRSSSCSQKTWGAAHLGSWACDAAHGGSMVERQAPSRHHPNSATPTHRCLKS
jgi:hypothetical protein